MQNRAYQLKHQGAVDRKARRIARWLESNGPSTQRDLRFAFGRSSSWVGFYLSVAITRGWVVEAGRLDEYQPDARFQQRFGPMPKVYRAVSIKALSSAG